jgi:hypothetical protein
MPSFRFFSLLFVAALGGCGAEPMELPRTYNASAHAAKTKVSSAEFGPPAAAADKPAGPALARGVATDGAVATLVATQAGQAPAAPAIARKIIYDAQIDLVVENVDPIVKKVTSLVQDARGYIAEQNMTGSPGSQRSMRWKIRVPVDQFDSLVTAIVSLGELERNNRTSQDVTEQYYDIEARIKNKKVEEQTLNRILQERSGKLEDVLKIETELSRVRGEIEQLEGKIRVLENLSSLATLTLSVREREKFAPPPPAVADFATQIARTWDASLLGLVNLGKALVLVIVGWALWVPVLIVAGLVCWFLLRWLFRVYVRNLPQLVALARTPITPPRPPAPSG